MRPSFPPRGYSSGGKNGGRYPTQDNISNNKNKYKGHTFHKPHFESERVITHSDFFVKVKPGQFLF